jgi:hypothetical protein
MWSRRGKKEELESTSRGLEVLKISEPSQRSQTAQDEESKVHNFRINRGKYNLTSEETTWLSENVFKHQRAEQDSLKSFLKVLVREVLTESSLQKDKQDPDSVGKSDLFEE